MTGDPKPDAIRKITQLYFIGKLSSTESFDRTNSKFKKDPIVFLRLCKNSEGQKQSAFLT